MLEGKDRYAINMVFTYMESSIDRGNRFEANYDLTSVDVQYTDIFKNKPLLD